MAIDDVFAHGDDVEALYKKMQSNLFEVIARRLKPGDPNMSVLSWQVEKMAQLGMLNKETLREISKATGVSLDKVEKAVRSAGMDTIYDTDSYLEGRETLPIENNLLDKIDTLVGEAKNRFNLINQTLMSNNGIQAKFLDVVNEITAQVLTGQVDLDTAIARTLNKWSDMGLTSPFVDSAGHRWSLERYLSTAIRSTVNNVHNQMREDRMADYDIHTVEVSHKPNARRACSKIQGHIVDLRRDPPKGSEFKSIYDPYWEAHYKEPAGCRGINCRHQLRPFDPLYDKPKTRKEMKKSEGLLSPEDARINEGLAQAYRRRELAIQRTRQHLKNARALGNQKEIKRNQALLAKQQENMLQFVQQNEKRLRLFRNRDVNKILG